MSAFDATGKEVFALSPNAAQEGGGNLDRLSASAPTQVELLQQILKELQITNRLLADGLNLDESDIQTYRNDSNFP
jgi:hypothetical protein